MDSCVFVAFGFFDSCSGKELNDFSRCESVFRVKKYESEVRFSLFLFMFLSRDLSMLNGRKSQSLSDSINSFFLYFWVTKFFTSKMAQLKESQWSIFCGTGIFPHRKNFLALKRENLEEIHVLFMNRKWLSRLFKIKKIRLDVVLWVRRIFTEKLISGHLSHVFSLDHFWDLFSPFLRFSSFSDISGMLKWHFPNSEK